MFEKNGLLEEITEELSCHKPNWPLILQEYNPIRCIKHKNEQFSNLVGELSEIYLRVSLREICRKYDGRILQNPILHGENTISYNFYNDKRKHLIAKNLFSNRDVCEIDDLMIIDDLPVMFEIKLTQALNHVDMNFRHRPNGCSMNQERSAHLFDPLKEYFHTDKLGYVVVLYKEVIGKYSLRQNQFESNNGIISPFYTDRNSFRNDVFFIFPCLKM